MSQAVTLLMSAVTPQGSTPELDRVMLWGFLAAVGTLICWPYRAGWRSYWIGSLVSQLALAGYCFVAGSWPAGIAIIGWASGTCVRAYRSRRATNQATSLQQARASSPATASMISTAMSATQPVFVLHHSHVHEYRLINAADGKQLATYSRPAGPLQVSDN